VAPSDDTRSSTGPARGNLLRVRWALRGGGQVTARARRGNAFRRYIDGVHHYLGLDCDLWVRIPSPTRESGVK